MNYIIEKSLRLLPDKLYLQLLYYKHLRKFINFKVPKTFCEKIQWLKLHDRRPEYSKMVDKIEIKKHVANIIGEKYIIPTLGVWDNTREIDWDSLPPQFVLKWNHDSGSIVICKDKNSFNQDEAIKKLQHGATFNGFWYGREWPYKNVPPRIIAEKYMSDGGSDLTDYKFFCFNGEPKYCQVIKDRHTHETIDFFDMAWSHMPFIGLNSLATPLATPSTTPIPKPNCLNEMIEISRKLAKDIPFVRVDLYEINKKVYFGEITFYPASGFGYFYPLDWNIKLGEMIKLPKIH